MKIVCFNPKGGAGKTPTSFALHQEFPSLQYITNDKNYGNNIKVILKDKYTFLDPDSVHDAKEILTLHKNFIFDAGGFTSNVIKIMMENCDYIVVPCPIQNEIIANTRQLLVNINAEKKIKAKKILLINKFKEDKYFEPSLILIKKLFKDLIDDIATLRETEVLVKLYKERCSMTEYVKRYPLYRNNKIFAEWEEFIKLINKN